MDRTEIVGKWLKTLGTLTAGSMQAEEARLRIGAYATLLAAEFQPKAFTIRSIEAVARRCKFFPSYAEIVEHLSAWWKENQPQLLALPGNGSPNGWCEKDQSWLDFWERHKAEGFANVTGAMRYPNVFPDEPVNHKRAHAASMIRRFSPLAWARISDFESRI